MGGGLQPLKPPEEHLIVAEEHNGVCRRCNVETRKERQRQGELPPSVPSPLSTASTVMVPSLAMPIAAETLDEK